MRFFAYFCLFILLLTSNGCNTDLPYGEDRFPRITLDDIVTLDNIAIENNIHFTALSSIQNEQLQIKSYGHCWSFSNRSPSINDNKTVFQNATGEFKSYINNLNLNSRVFIRAYAKKLDDEVMYTAVDSIEIDFTAVKSWQRMGPNANEASYPEARLGGIAFSDEESYKIYYGLGRNKLGEPLNDFWEFDPVRNNWLELDTLPGSKRWAAVGFKINNSIYIGSGDIGKRFAKDFFQFDISSKKWVSSDSSLDNFPGKGSKHAVGFTIGNKGFVGFGCVDTLCSGGIFSDSIFAFEPNEGWSQVDCPNCTARYGSIGIVIRNEFSHFFGAENADGTPPFEFLMTLDTYNESNGWNLNTIVENLSGRVVAILFYNDGIIYTGFGQQNEFVLNDFYKIEDGIVTPLSPSSDDEYPNFLTFSTGVSLAKVGFIIGGTKTTDEDSFRNATNEVWTFIPNL